MPMTEQTSLSTGTKRVDIHGEGGTQENLWKSKHAPRYFDGTTEDLRKAGQKLEAVKKKLGSAFQFEAGGTGTMPTGNNMTGPHDGIALAVGLKRKFASGKNTENLKHVRTLGPKVGVKDAEDRPKVDVD
jgi:hypothetical protein